MVSLSSFFYLLLLQQIFQVIIARDALQFLLHNLLHLFLDTPVVRLHRFFHAVVAVLVREIGNDRNFLVGTFLPLHLLGIHHNLAVKNFLFDTFVEVVGHRTDKHSLRQTGNLARRNERICVLMEVETSCRLMEIDCRFCNTLPNRSDSVFAVSPTTCPEKMLPTVFITTFASLSP